MTSEERVKAKWPDAACIETLPDSDVSYFWIHRGDPSASYLDEGIGTADTRDAAWQDAADRMEGGDAKDNR